MIVETPIIIISVVAHAYMYILVIFLFKMMNSINLCIHFFSFTS